MEVRIKKLGREKLWGQADSEDKSITLDPRLQKKKHLEILIHEAFHHLEWGWTEDKVIRHSKKLANLLWKQGYRKCDV